MQYPLVSIIIPTYNRGHLIEKAIESVLAQTYPNWQLIVVDDGSTDDTPERLLKYSALDYYRQKKQGQAAARNTGLCYCRGQYVASLDAADEWQPNFLADGVAMLEKHRLDFVFQNWSTSPDSNGFASFFQSPRNKRRFCTQFSTGWWLLNAEQTRRLIVETCLSPASSLLIRHSSLSTNWNTQMRLAEDWCLVLDLVMNRPCRSAFTIQPRWIKHIQTSGIGNCKDHIPTILDLGFHDEPALAKRYQLQLTGVEKRIFRRRQAMHHVNFAYVSWKQSVALTNVVSHLRTAFRLAPFAVGLTLASWGQELIRKRLLAASV